MRVLRTAVLVVAALAAVAVATAVAAEPTDSEKAAIAAGKEAGAAAGAAAGHKTGAEAGKLAATGDFAEKMTPAQFKEMAAKNTGAALFFNDFDKDGNHHWSKAEFLPALRALISRNMLPAEYDAEGNWEKLPRSIEGEVNFRDFVTWASTMKARPPPAAAAAAAAAAANKSAAAAAKPSDAKDCKAVFNKYDKDGSNTLDEAEFRASMQGRYDDSKLGAVYAELDRKGSKGTLAEDAYTTFCAKLTGMPKDGDAAAKAAAAAKEGADPCSGDPCAKIENTVCRADPKKCVKEPCPQFKCVEAEKQDAGNSTAGAPRSPYAKCVVLFDQWDDNSKDNQLTYAEFERGVARERAAGRMGNFPADRAWEALEHDGNTLDVYEFVHFCLAQSAGEQDPDTIDQECFEVFSHWDRNPRDLTLNGREFWKGMRRAKRQGHLPARVNVKRVWADLPKKDGEVQPGPFVDFCRAMSKGAEPEAAAKDTQAPQPVAPQAPDLDAAAAKEVDEALKAAAAGGNKTAAEELAGGAAKVEYKAVESSSSGENSTGVDNVGHASKAPADAFCTAAYHKADGNADDRVTASEFKFACAEVAPAKACANYTQVFDAFDADGKGYLSHVDFVRLCKVSGNRTAAGTVQLDSAYLKKLAAGADAGARAGARAGAEAGRQAGVKAGIEAARKHHAEEKYDLGSSASSSGSDEDDESVAASGDDDSSSSGGDEEPSASGAAEESASEEESSEESSAADESEVGSESDAAEESSDEAGSDAAAAEDSTTEDEESSEEGAASGEGEEAESSSDAAAAEESSEEGGEADAAAASSGDEGEESSEDASAAAAAESSDDASASGEAEAESSEDSVVAGDAVSGSEESVGDNTSSGDDSTSAGDDSTSAGDDSTSAGDDESSGEETSASA